MTTPDGSANGRHARRQPAAAPRAASAVLAGVLCAALLAGAGYGQSGQSGASGQRRASRIEADTWIDRVVDGQRISYFYDNVVLDRDSLVAYGDTAYWYRDRDEYELLGDVRILQTDGTLNCRRAVYRMAEGAGDFYRDVRVRDGEITATGRRGESRREGRILRLIGDALLVTPEYSVLADTVMRDRRTGESEAFGNVRIMEPEAKSIVTGRHALFEAAGQVAVIDRDPHLTSREQGGGPLTSTARLMRFYRAEDRVVMIDSVRIRHDQTDARADTAIAYGREHLVLRGSPRVSTGGKSEMFGEQIEFFYEEGELRRIILVEQARMEDLAPDSLAAIYGGLPQMDVLEGDSITIDLRDDEVRRSVVVGSAHSIYTPLDLTGEVATNDVTGDTITIDFRRGKVNKVTVEGNMAGTYRFARISAMEQRAGLRMREAERLARTAPDSLFGAAGDSVAAADSLAAPVDIPLSFTQLDSLAHLVPDTLAAAAPDTLAAAGADSAIAPAPGDLDFLNSATDVVYSGGRLEFEMSDRAIDIARDGKLTYGTMTLTADHIKLDTDERELYAEGDPLVEDSEIIAGDQMGYNFGAKTGAVEDGVTAFDDYYYRGREIRRFPDTTMKICSGRMTSCDLEKPHYHFWSNKMKIRMEDKVVAAPIVLRVGEVPIFALPFYFRNLKEGRRSGILFPSFDFGFSSREGRYIRDFGYYWATNEYLDFLVEGDYNERQDLAFRMQNRYVKRYTMKGGVDYSWRNGLGGNNIREWQLRWNHDQPNLFDDYTFKADVKLASQTLTSDDLAGSRRRDIIPGQRISKFYVSRNFSFLNVNLNVRRDERANVSDDYAWTDTLLSNTTLPEMTLNFRQFTLAPSLRPGQKGSFLGDLLRNTYFKHDYSYRAETEKREITTIKDQYASGKWSLSVRPPRVGIFNVSFSANASQAWSRSTLEGQEWVPGIAETDSTEAVDGYLQDVYETEEDTSPAASFGGSVNTTLYGLFPARVGKLRAVRHTLSFKTGWSQRVGMDGRPPSSSFSFDLGNRFDAKYAVSGQDTTETTRKLDGFLDWSLRTSFNPRADSGEQWSDISSGLTVKPGQSRYLKLTVNNTIDPYTFSLKSTRFNYSVNLNFQGRLDLGADTVVTEEKRSAAIDRIGELAPAKEDTLQGKRPEDFDGFGEGPDDAFEDEFDDGFARESSFDDMYNREDRRQRDDGTDKTEGGRYLPFQIRPNLSYNYSDASEDNRHRATGGLTVSANLTRGWEMRYTTQFNLVESTATRQQFTLTRDLHCWRMEFNRTVSSVDSQFGFRIYLKSIPALKLTRGREDYMGSLSDGLGGGF